MSISIKCPFCFKSFKDDEVHFRAPFVSEESAAPTVAGKTIRTIDDFKRIEATDPDKINDKIRREVSEWLFFYPKIDERYNDFWNKYGGSTEDEDIKKDSDKKLLMYRRVIIPQRDTHYLVEYDNSHVLERGTELDRFFLRSQQKNKIVTRIQVRCGKKIEKTDMRVCPYCHNPLPSGYGEYDIKFIPVIGTVGAGKTVYLSQFLDGIDDYMYMAGLNLTQATTENVDRFLEKNPIEKGVPLPGPTKAGRFEQPLIINASKKGETLTIVMYDVAGEVFGGIDPETNRQFEIEKYAPFILNADGIVLLIDPIQFKKVRQQLDDDFNNTLKNNKQKKDPVSPAKILQVIHQQIINSKNEYNKPLAVCVSKIDEMERWFNDQKSLIRYIQTDYEGVPVDNGDDVMKTIYDMESHKAFEETLSAFIGKNSRPLKTQLINSYSNVHYFGFTALGCPVEENMPIYEPSPHRIEEPILWILSQIGFIGINDSECEFCHEKDATIVEEFVDRQRFIVPRDGILGVLGATKEIYIKKNVNCRCNSCGKFFLRKGWKVDKD